MKFDVTWPPPGKYVLAVSGGADSMVLLDLLAGAAGERGYELVVAHFDHGLRPGSEKDAEFAAAAAASHALPFETTRAQLPSNASEAAARQARHAWLKSIRARHQAAAVVMAHHLDDLLETSLLNLARGTGRHGLVPMQDGRIVRPLIHLSRADLRAYAGAHSLSWREDPTNADLANPRNLLRHVILPNATQAWQSHYLKLLARLGRLNKQIDQSISVLFEEARSGQSSYSFSRQLIRELTLPELAELLYAATLELQPGAELERRAVEEIALFAKTASPHRRRPLCKDICVVVDRQVISVYYIGTSDR